MLKIGEIYRLPKQKSGQKPTPVVDGLPNFYFETQTPGVGFAFQKGIHPVQEVETTQGNKRRPLIIISSTPRKAGNEGTPWHDEYDSDYGIIKYYGDNKFGDTNPEDTPGNKTLLSFLKYYNSGDMQNRLNHAIPIVFFERCTYGGRQKGNAKFHGYGILESAELVTQYDYHRKGYFSNYLFSFCVLSLAKTNVKQPLSNPTQ